jgi:hypothetical protein
MPARRTTRLLVALAALILLAAGCGDDGGDDNVAAGSTSTTAADDGGGDAFMVEASPLSADLGTDPDTNYLTGSDGTELFPPGSVTAHWYTAGDVYAVVYTGAPTDDDLCPGGSVFTDQGDFANVSNAPSGDPAGCEGFPTLDPAASARVCGPVIVFTSVIPADAGGTLYGTLEKADPSPDLIASGATSTVDTAGMTVPEIDPEAAAYSFPTDMVAEGDVTC